MYVNEKRRFPLDDQKSPPEIARLLRFPLSLLAVQQCEAAQAGGEHWQRRWFWNGAANHGPPPLLIDAGELSREKKVVAPSANPLITTVPMVPDALIPVNVFSGPS